jgi:2,4-dienoyl-CoA reductase-like NADH-dependent reductase (Old Yellow Enzyme family)
VSSQTRRFPTLLSPIELGSVTVRNRIVSSGHATRLADDRKAGVRFRAYHRARAVGGAGLIITEASFLTMDDSYSSAQLVCGDDSIIPDFVLLADELHAEGATVFGQLLHLGLEHASGPDGTRAAAWGPSEGSGERYHTAGRPMTKAAIAQTVADFAAGAARMKEGKLDGVEIAASHGYLIAQFLSPEINQRADEYGGPIENRMRLLREIIAAVRSAIGPDMALGVRISGDEMTTDGLNPDDTLEVCRLLGDDGTVDYFNITIGSSRQIAGAVHIVSPMSTDMGITTPFARRIKQVVEQPVIAVGRINHPVQAEQVLASGDADMCGMTRALICDPEMPNKTAADQVEDIRICIACNQACIDRFHRGWGISCIQHPETGRELSHGIRIAARAGRDVMVVGGGPAGMKAAAVAAERGHRVTLYEAGARLGGQARLAELLPSRSEFGGIVENLAKEMDRAGVVVRLATPIDVDAVIATSPDAVIIATGAVAGAVEAEIDGAHVLDAWDVLQGATPGRNVLIADSRCDWIGLGVAELLVRAGHKVRLASAGHIAGETIPRYTRDLSLGTLHRLGVELVPMTRLYGADEDTVYLQHMASGEPVICGHVDTLVLAQRSSAARHLEDSLSGSDFELHIIGDCKAPRTAEEAVLEGLEAGSRV